MQQFSQGSEQEFIVNYFNGYIGVFADFGANQGTIFSNTRALALNNWAGILVEPSPEAYKQLWELYKGNDKMELFNCAVSDKAGEVTLYHSGEHIGIGDISLLSTLKKEETTRWQSSGEKFEEIKVQALTFNQILEQTPFETVDIISLDIESMELEIMPQIDFVKLGVKLLCVEWNSKDQHLYDEIMLPLGYKLGFKNLENLIYTK